MIWFKFNSSIFKNATKIRDFDANIGQQNVVENDFMMNLCDSYSAYLMLQCFNMKGAQTYMIILVSDRGNFGLNILKGKFSKLNFDNILLGKLQLHLMRAQTIV